MFTPLTDVSSPPFDRSWRCDTALFTARTGYGGTQNGNGALGLPENNGVVCAAEAGQTQSVTWSGAGQSRAQGSTVKAGDVSDDW